jgi:hypothetical protein
MPARRVPLSIPESRQLPDHRRGRFAKRKSGALTTCRGEEKSVGLKLSVTVQQSVDVTDTTSLLQTENANNVTSYSKECDENEDPHSPSFRKTDSATHCMAVLVG